MLEKSAITQVPIADLIAHRWSPRAIDPDQPVRREQLMVKWTLQSRPGVGPFKIEAMLG